MGKYRVKKTNPKLIRLVEELNTLSYQDGTTLGKKCGVTRSAIWKLIKQLMLHDIAIESVKNKGYLLLEPLILLDRNKIAPALNHLKMELHLLDSVSSTNDYLKNLKKSSLPQICLAEMQMNGKGRLGRVWHSPYAKNIYLSCRYPFKKDLSELGGFSLAMSLAVHEVLKNYLNADLLKVKWPNDILFAQQKIAGILIELEAESHGMTEIIIGIGINVNMQSFNHESIKQPWTSLRSILNKTVDRNEMAILLIKQLLVHFKIFHESGLTPFKTLWQKNDALLHKIITLKSFQKNITGEVLGINDEGHLLLKLADEKIMAFSAGDVSIVKK